MCERTPLVEESIYRVNFPDDIDLQTLLNFGVVPDIQWNTKSLLTLSNGRASISN